MMYHGLDKAESKVEYYTLVCNYYDTVTTYLIIIQFIELAHMLNS